MRPLVGRGLGGPSFRGAANGRLGEPAWGPAELLRDLELRLGLPHDEAAASTRIPQWSQRLSALIGSEPFYGRSYAVDPLGTAATLLAWRDGLVESGWDGRPVPEGGPRLAALAALEASDASRLYPGRADRLARVESEFRRSSAVAIYDQLLLCEDPALWSTRWRAIFGLLEGRDTPVVVTEPQFPGASGTTDLGKLQRLLRGDGAAGSAKPELRFDGTLLLVRGDTLGELAELTASYVSAHRVGALVVRCVDPAPLEAAMSRQGLPAQGHAGSSGWRPAMQVLPLALELAFAPKDPYRVLELLTLPVGPFQGRVGAGLARAVAREPGVLGREWLKRKQRVGESLRTSFVRDRAKDDASEERISAEAEAYVRSRLQRVEEWIEAPGADAKGASREVLAAVVTRVRTWLQKRLGASEDAETYGAAYAQAVAMGDALAGDPRGVFSREDAQYLLDSVARGADGVPLSVETAGRVPHVAHPDALLAPVDTLVFWGFVAGAERRVPVPPWNAAERRSLDAVGVGWPEPGKLLARESGVWRRGVLAARERVVFVVPSTVKASPASPHALWDEIAARLGLDNEIAASRITTHAHQVLAGDAGLVAVATHPALALPEPRAAWTLPKGRVAAAGSLETSPTALEHLATCPLRFVLDQVSTLESGAIAKVAAGPLLNGNLGHRLVEELHRDGAFARSESEFHVRAEALLGQLLEREGATLLLPGAAFERAQLVPQMLRAMRELRSYLATAGFRIVAVEESVTTPSAIGTLHGRLDVRLENDAGESAVLDLKWGAASYRDLLEQGRAIQLAAYARAVAATSTKRTLPAAAYYSLSSSTVITADVRMNARKTLDGPTLAETWTRVERTGRTVLKHLNEGDVHVAATKRALPLLVAMKVPKGEIEKHHALAAAEDACKYCDYPAICGRAWESVR